MSHEIRTPLNSILGYAQMLAREADLEPCYEEYVRKIILSSGHLLSLINDVLDLSKIEVGRMDVVESVFDIDELIQAVNVILSPKAVEKGLELVIGRANTVARYIRTDEAKLRQVIVNLLGNAIKFTSRGQVRLWFYMEEGAGARELLLAEVHDTGPGIPLDEMDQLFEPFTQLGRDTHEGTGLGLAISREYARLLGGDIRVASETGKGSAFTLSVPVGVEVIESKRSSTQGKGRVVGLMGDQERRVLVVDDNQDAVLFTSRYLELIGFVVKTARDGVEALEVFAEFRPDIVLMDRRMPRLDGLEAMQQMKAQYADRHTPVVMVSASAFDEDYRECIVSGADGFIRKPFLEEDLLREISRLTGIQYRYEPVAPRQRSRPLVPEDLARIPQYKSEQIIGSIVKGDLDAALAGIEGLKEVDEWMVESLKDLALTYQYDALLELMQRKGPSTQHPGKR